MSRSTEQLLAASEARAALREGRFRELRESHGFSQGEVARTVGVDVSALWRWEAGLRTPRLEVAARLALVLRALEAAERDRRARGDGHRLTP
jgi:transcriptional regulator with XRE-family HTH domain